MRWLNALLPVLTLILGYVGTLVTESRRDARARRLAKEERNDQLSAAHAGERRTFELETLNALMVATQRLARATGAAHHFDLMQAKERGVDTYPSTQLPEAVSKEAHEAGVEVRRLQALVLDKRTRELVDAFHSSTASLGMPPVTVAEANEQMIRILDAYEAAQEAVGARIRGIYEGPVTTS